ncbi:hypothetical protein DOS84_08630 [Flavobacterium aquariorum]|uniref:Uncharacterized protein n=1 Tax=Flavobacterium aquariorum TaxID=2217670 RepID=A0A2W7TVG0_9FLAO|nr:hypothetical protein [Flavobacterium aquariorum]PZX93998.1 hypothetical protein DOS84_08630 [Flavobacterium aquariorum]
MKRTIKTIILFFAFLIGVGSYAVSAQNPPAHAKAHGVKKKYRYYPESNVYFDPVVKKYTYLKGGTWTTVVSLPTTIRLIGSYNDFDFEGDNPWKENSMHKTKYKPTKSVKSTDIKKIDHDYDSKSYKGNNGGKKK